MKKISLKKAVAKLAALCGKSRVRTLTAEDLLQALAEARRGAYGLRAGPTVANCYGYPAYRMRLVAIRRRSGSYAVLANWGSARRGSSRCPLGGRKTAWVRKLSANKRRLDDSSWWILSGKEVTTALAQRRLLARLVAEKNWPAEDCPVGLLVTRHDSTAAGNCRTETERVAAWWPLGTEAVSSDDLRERILARDPTLTPYARRAVERAQYRINHCATVPGDTRGEL